MNELAIDEAIRRVQAGNVEDYRIVVIAFHQRLRTGIAALCPPEVEAEEIAHLAFLHAYRHIDEYRLGTNFHAYSASKGGMIALSRSIATTYGPQNVRSNVICPGFIETPMTAEISDSQRLRQAYLENTPLHRAGRAVDVAYMALYLASDEAAFVTGGTFVIDGGVTAR